MHSLLQYTSLSSPTKGSSTSRTSWSSWSTSWTRTTPAAATGLIGRRRRASISSAFFITWRSIGVFGSTWGRSTPCRKLRRQPGNWTRRRWVFWMTCSLRGASRARVAWFGETRRRVTGRTRSASRAEASSTSLWREQRRKCNVTCLLTTPKDKCDTYSSTLLTLKAW